MKKVMVFGTFDIVHIGHIHMFQEAKDYGDKLIVAVARDNNVETIKGMGPLHTENERKKFLENIKIIDQAVLGYENDPYRIINEIKPDIIGLGYDQKIYVDNLARSITDFGLSIQIVRLKPYQEERFKSAKIRKYIERVM